MTARPEPMLLPNASSARTISDVAHSPDGSLIAFQQGYQGARGKSYQIVVIDPQTQKTTYVRDREGMTREPYGRMWRY